MCYSNVEVPWETYNAILKIIGTQANGSPINRTARKKKLELDARKGLVDGWQLVIKEI